MTLVVGGRRMWFMGFHCGFVRLNLFGFCWRILWNWAAVVLGSRLKTICWLCAVSLAGQFSAWIFICHCAKFPLYNLLIFNITGARLDVSLRFIWSCAKFATEFLRNWASSKSCSEMSTYAKGRRSLPVLTSRSSQVQALDLNHDLDLYYIRQIASHFKVGSRFSWTWHLLAQFFHSFYNSLSIYFHLVRPSMNLQLSLFSLSNRHSIALSLH